MNVTNVGKLSNTNLVELIYHNLKLSDLTLTDLFFKSPYIKSS